MDTKDQKEKKLVQEALSGNSNALGSLIEAHQNFIYNVVWKMVLNPQDAEDITQDIIIKVITNLSKFKEKSAFRTWVYRIAFNHVLNIKKRPMEESITTFEEYGRSLDHVKDQRFIIGQNPTPEENMIIKDVMFGCTAGMLLCLDRNQRLVYILGELFEIDSKIGSNLLEISPDNYRQQLTRARKQLYQFMNDKCGLINKKNPCRCQKKTKSFIENGWVDPKNLKFNIHYMNKIREHTKENCDEMDTVLDEKYAEIYRDHYYDEKTIFKDKIAGLIKGKDFRNVFDLN